MEVDRDVTAGNRRKLRPTALKQRHQQAVDRFRGGNAQRIHPLSQRRRRWRAGQPQRLQEEAVATLALDRLEVALAFDQQPDVTRQDLAARQALSNRKLRVDPTRDLGEAIERNADEGET